MAAGLDLSTDAAASRERGRGWPPVAVGDRRCAVAAGASASRERSGGHPTGHRGGL